MGLGLGGWGAGGLGAGGLGGWGGWGWGSGLAGLSWDLGWGLNLALKPRLGLSLKLGFASQFRLGASFGFWEPIFGFGKLILGFGTIWGFGSQFWALGGDLGFGLPGPGKAPEV